MSQQRARMFEVSTPLADDLLRLKSLHGVEHMGALFEYRLTLLGADHQISRDAVLGEAMSVRIELPNGDERHIHGIVTFFGHHGAEGRHARYEVVLRPWLWMLTRSRDCRMFQGKTAPEIIQEVFRAHGFTDFENHLQGSFPEREYCVQYRESDYDFVARLMKEEGAVYYFLHDENKHTLVLANKDSVYESRPGFEELSFAHEGDEDDERGTIRAWNTHWQVQPGAYATTSYDFMAPNADLAVRSSIAQAHPHAMYEVYDYPGRHLEVRRGEADARVRMEALAAQYEMLEGYTHARGLTAGQLFRLREHPRDEQNREYLVTGCKLEISVNAFESSRDDETRFDCHLWAVGAQVPYCLPQTVSKPAILGPQTAVVVGKAGEEIWTDEYGRVKVQFHWDRDGQRNENSSCWVRVAQAWAGDRFGAMQIPRIGQEVIVEFLDGDPDRPIITGSVYNNANRPPWALPANRTQSGIKSRSTKGGGMDNANEIRFEDNKGQEELFVQAERNHTVKVKQSRSLSVGASESISVGGTRSTSVKKKNTETYEDEHEVIVTGKVTETYEDEHQWSIANNQTIEVTADKEEHVTGTYALTTDTAYQLVQGGTSVKLEGDAMEMDIADSLRIKRGSAQVELDDGGAITIKSDAGIVIQCGDSVVEITPSGISLNGKMIVATAETSEVMLDSSMAKMSGTNVNVEASAIATILGTTAVKLN